VAEEQEEHRYTAKEQITFAPSSLSAFDRSGKSVKHSILADGSLMAEHNGSLGHVMVARLGPDGKVETYCTTHEDAAISWMAGKNGGTSVTLMTTSDSDK